MYRDDREALLARLDSTLLECDELRARNAELELELIVARLPPSSGAKDIATCGLESGRGLRHTLRSPAAAPSELAVTTLPDTTLARDVVVTPSAHSREFLIYKVMLFAFAAFLFIVFLFVIG